MAGYSERIKQETEYSILWCSLGSNGCPIRTRTKPYSSSDTIFNNKGEVSHTEKRCRSVILSVLNSFGVRSSCRSFCGMLRAATGYHPVGVGLMLSSLNFAHSLLSQMTPLFSRRKCAFRSYTQLLYSTSGTSSAYLQQRWRGSDSRNFFVGKKKVNREPPEGTHLTRLHNGRVCFFSPTITRRPCQPPCRCPLPQWTLGTPLRSP